MSKRRADRKVQVEAQPMAGGVDRGLFALAQPRVDRTVDLNAHSVWLSENDVTTTEACRRIKSLSDMRFYFRVARDQMEAGGERNLRNAERITRLCLIHPELGDVETDTSTLWKPNLMERK